jgi:transposase
LRCECCDLGVLLPHLAGLVIDGLQRVGGLVRLAARVAVGTASCPGCGQPSSRVHGKYRRTLTDAAIAGMRVLIELLVRRFRCRNGECATVTFVEQVPELTRPHARYTRPAETMLSAVGLALAGRAGARLAQRLGLTAGRDTLLRRVRELPDPEPGCLPVLGVDDFALRRGHVYGTVIVDMDTHRPVDVLPGRDAAPLADWLAAHPGVEVVCRDRSGAYAEAIRTGAPDAVQVADRFHLWKNLGEAVEKTVAAHRRALAEPPPDQPGPADQPEPDTPPVPVPDDQPPAAPAAPETRLVARTRARYREVQALLAQGLSRSAVSRTLGLDPHTVRRFANATSVDDLLVKTTKASKLDPFKAHLHARWNAGVTDAARLTEEISELGYTGSDKTVRRYLHRFRDGRPAPPPGPVPATVREVTRWILTHPDRLDPDDQLALKTILARSPDLDRLTRHVGDFAQMLTKLEGHRLGDWITAVEADTLTPLTSFARHLRNDLAAVTAGLTLPYSSGAVEGNVNRIKMLKRQMYGRANFDLLRRRILLAH